MQILRRLSLGVAALSIPIAAYAMTPVVTGIHATNTNGQVQVTWSQAAGDIASYRIYYGSRSILKNSGIYDDFEMVDGSVNSHTLLNIPPTQSNVYVSVLAVDSGGQESPYFAEEAHVTLNVVAASSAAISSAQTVSSISSSSSSSFSSSPSSSTSEVLRLLSAEAISNTGVLLRFSHQVTIPQPIAAVAIIIKYGSGERLVMQRYVIEGNDVIVHTQMQRPGTVYSVQLSPAVTSRTADGRVIPLDREQAPMFFTGFAGDAMQHSSSMSAKADDVRNLRIAASATANGYDVEASWQAPSADGIAGYRIAQTTDKGRTYTGVQIVQPGTLAVRIKGVPAGSFGVLVQTLYSDGRSSQGVAQYIDLQDGLQGSVRGHTPGLPDSGPAATVAIMAVSGMCGAWHVRRKRMSALVR